MTDASPTAKPVEFRGGTLTVTTALLRETEPARLADALHVMLGGMPDFFSGEALVLDFAQLPQVPERIDWPGLLSLLRRYQTQPVGVCNLPDALVAGARQAGVAVLPTEPAAVRQPEPDRAPAPAPAAVPAASPAGRAATMFVDRPLRSGQQIYARDADLVVLGGVSPGAEVIADGSIHCYGPLRGRALAGARGDAAARIIAANFGPELISIAGVYRTFEKGIPESVAGRAAQVRLTGDADRQNLNLERIALD